MFTVLDAINTARVSMNDPRPNHWASREVDTLSDLRSIAYAILCFAKERGIRPAEVEYSIRYPQV